MSSYTRWYDSGLPRTSPYHWGQKRPALPYLLGTSQREGKYDAAVAPSAREGNGHTLRSDDG